MLPIFLSDLRRNHHQELVEITLELEEDSVVVCNVGPAPAPDCAGDENGVVSRTSSSITSRIRRKFPWLRSLSSRTSVSSESASAAIEDPVISARNARKIKAQLERTRSTAQRALKGLRFINKTTGENDSDELWKKVEERFELLAKDGLLAREDFGECIGE